MAYSPFLSGDDRYEIYRQNQQRLQEQIPLDQERLQMQRQAQPMPQQEQARAWGPDPFGFAKQVGSEAGWQGGPAAPQVPAPSQGTITPLPVGASRIASYGQSPVNQTYQQRMQGGQQFANIAGSGAPAPQVGQQEPQAKPWGTSAFGFADAQQAANAPNWKNSQSRMANYGQQPATAQMQPLGRSFSQYGTQPAAPAQSQRQTQSRSKQPTGAPKPAF